MPLIDVCIVALCLIQNAKTARVPREILEITALIERYITTENAGEIEEQLGRLMEPFMPKGKDKPYTDICEICESISLS